MTSGSLSKSRRNATFVPTPSTTVEASAASSRRSAVDRSGPHAATFASIGS